MYDISWCAACWLQCPALCAAQGNRASAPAPSAASQDGEDNNPFTALRKFFERVLPQAESPKASESGASPAETAPPPAPASAPAPVVAPAPAVEPAPAAAPAPSTPKPATSPPTDASPAPAAAPAPTPTAAPANSAAPSSTATPAVAPAVATPPTPPAVPPATADEAAPGIAPAAVITRSGIALILPTKAASFARAADVTRAGFMAAREAGSNPVAVTLFETDGSPERARSAYREAAAKSLVVVGPLTRGEVGALMNETMPVQTLVLNLPESAANAPAVKLPNRMRALALNIEQEAQSAARAVFSTDAQRAVVVTTNSPLQKRAASAFADAWIALGGQIGEPVEYAGNLARVRQGVERAKPDAVFLAADAPSARLLRPYLGRNTTVIATSQVYAGPPKSEAQKFHDMNGIRFIDMPWLHLADRAALGFAVSGTPLTPDLERLYALGIDAYRVARELARGRAEFDLDGVTGKLKVHDGTIEREPIQAEYRDGEVSQVR